MKPIPPIRAGLALLGLCAALRAGSAHGEEVYQMGYFETRGLEIYDRTLAAVKKSLKQAGWEDKIEFPPEAFLQLGNKKEPEWRQAAAQLLARQDLEVVFAAGTKSAELLLHATHQLPPEVKRPVIVAGAVSDAVRSGFVPADSRTSQNPFFTVRVVPGRYRQMFEIFHDEVMFQRLGLLYLDSSDGRVYSSVDDAEAVAAEPDRRFSIAHRTLPETYTDADCRGALKFLVEEQRIDAFFIPSMPCFDWTKNDVASFLAYLNQNRVRTFSRQGSKDVRAGALFAFSSVDYEQRGRFLADVIIRVIKGEDASKLPMEDSSPPTIALNMKVAKDIGYPPSYDILGACDEIFEDIELPEDRYRPPPPTGGQGE